MIYHYDPYGNIRSESGNVVNNYRFQSEQVDPETGLVYLRARHYDPTTSRFISRDPVSGSLIDPRTQNGYDYSLNNPVNYSDPSGETPLNVLMFLGGGLTLAGLEVGGAINGAYNSCDRSLGGVALSAAVGAQQALESPVGQAAFGVATLGAMTAGSPSSRNVIQSTGRNIATNPNEEAAIAKAMANPAGGFKLPIELGDPRWPASGGWVKMTQNINGIEIHYNLNEITKETADWKFK